MQPRTLLLSACLLGGLTAVNLSAAQISGLFSIDGNITVTQDMISWANTNSPFTPNQANIGDDGTDSFASLDGTTVTIQDLTSSTEPVGSDFGPDLFISFDAAPTMPTLDINFVYPGVFTGTDCAATPAVGQTCTPAGPTPGEPSPFSFTNVEGNQGNPPIESDATFTFGGVTSDGGIWEGQFSADFDTPYQQVLTELAANGSVTDTYASELTVTVQAGTPEPGSGYLFASGFALVLLSLGSRRLLRRQRQ
jgi:hypothetical protein